MEKIKRIVKDISKVLFICMAIVIILNIIAPTYISGVCMGVLIGLFICDMCIVIDKNSNRKDNLELKLEKIMHYATGGFLSNINLSYETIEDAIADHIKECADEAAKKVKKDYNIE